MKITIGPVPVEEPALLKEAPHTRPVRSLDRDTRIRMPHADDDPRTSVSMRDHGCELLLFFDNPSGEGPVLELRLLPDTAELDPRVLRSFMPRAPLYAKYARAAIQFDRGEIREALFALRSHGATSRGLNDAFYRVVATEYAALIEEGELHPVKALGEVHHVVISTASRWLKEARRRGLLEGSEK